MKFGLKQQDIEQINNILANYFEIEQAIIYGSRAKGNYKPASDIDLTFKGKTLNNSIINKISWQLDDLLLPYTFDLSIFHQINNQELIEHINRHSFFLKRIISNK